MPPREGEEDLELSSNLTQVPQAASHIQYLARLSGFSRCRSQIHPFITVMGFGDLPEFKLSFSSPSGFLPTILPLHVIWARGRLR